MCAQSTWQGKTARQISASYMNRVCIVQLCEYVFPIGFPLYVPKMGFWGFWKWRCENALFWPPKGTTLCEYASVGVFCVKIGSTACRGVYTIESLEQMLQKNFRGGRFDVEPGGGCIRKKYLQIIWMYLSSFIHSFIHNFITHTLAVLRCLGRQINLEKYLMSSSTRPRLVAALLFFCNFE